MPEPPGRLFADTAFFLDYLTDAEPARADAVDRLLQDAAAGRVVLVSHTLVLVELVRALERDYGLPRPEIRDRVLAILNTPGLEVAGREVVLHAVVRYAEGDVEFMDAYNLAWTREAGIAAPGGRSGSAPGSGAGSAPGSAGSAPGGAEPTGAPGT